MRMCFLFSRFLVDPERKQLWLNAIGKSRVPKTSRICGRHFDENSYKTNYGLGLTKKLLCDAVPNILIRKAFDNITNVSVTSNPSVQDVAAPSTLKTGYDSTLNIPENPNLNNTIPTLTDAASLDIENSSHSNIRNVAPPNKKPATHNLKRFLRS